MKKLKEEQINPFSILFPIIFLINCKDNLPKRENWDEKKVVDSGITLPKGDFFNCTGARDTVFANGDYLEYIPIDNENYSIEVRMNNLLDTLDFYLSCKTHSGMIPKVLFRSDLGYLGLGQGSSSYRYVTLCSIIKEEKRINVNRFETAIDVSSEKDGFFFIKEDSLWFYDINNKTLYSKTIPGNSNNSGVKEFRLYKDRAIIFYRNDGSQTLLLSEFRPAAN